MSDITKAINKIDKIIDSIDYSYIKIEIMAKNQQYTMEKDNHKSIGFKAGVTNE